MKTFKPLAILVVTIGTLLTAQAFGQDSKNYYDFKKEFEAKLSNKISHSDLSWDIQHNTDVVVELFISETGQPIIVAINGENNYKELVTKKLEILKLQNKSLCGKVFVCRFKFRTN